MAYIKQTWNNQGEGPPTLINAVRLNYIEEGIESAHDEKADLVHAHPDLASDVELAAHAGDLTLHGGQHPDLAAHDTMGLATQAELNAHQTAGHDPAASDLGVVVHAANANIARPTGYTSIMWIGSVDPVNSLPNDMWFVR